MIRALKWPFPFSPSPVSVVHALGLGAVLVGVCFWANQLQEPRVTPPPASAPRAPASDPVAQAVASWMGPGQLRLNISVVGLMRRQDRAVAVLTVNGAQPKAFMAGETLVRGATLLSIEPDSVVVDRAGTATRIAAPVRPDPGPAGIVRVD